MTKFTLAVMGLALLFAEPLFASARLSDDGGGNDDDDEADEFATQVQQDAGPAPPTKSAVAELAGGNDEAQAGPVATPMISMHSSLDRFGKKHVAKAAPAQNASEAVKANASAKEATKVNAKEAQVAVDAKNAHIAAESAKEAASVANKVATHSVHITEHAKDALQNARDALHMARVDTKGLSKGQKKSLKAAEAKLKEATKKAEYGQVKNAKYVKADVENKKLQKLEDKMTKIKMDEKKSKDGELEAMRKEIEELRKQLKKKEGDKADDDAMLKDLEDEIKEMEAAEKKDNHKDKKSHDELKAEIEKLRQQIKDMEDAKKEEKVEVKYVIPEEKAEVPEAPKAPKHPLPEKEEQVEKYKVEMKPLPKQEEEEVEEQSEATPVESKGIDIDTAMPYGDLEPFGREDTAQELTESSIRESDGMVDQLERAEVSEEKRAVFRALTRLRGAAITSFDGVARSQTGNIDEYNKIHKWRNNHPLHHLADEESDVSKWAFPDNADFLQVGITLQEEPLPPACYKITCADIDCRAPFELKRGPGQCCPVCFASEEDVALDRHTAMQGKNPYLVDAAAAAPTTCGGVKCFKPSCTRGFSKGFVQGRCCESCVAR